MKKLTFSIQEGTQKGIHYPDPKRQPLGFSRNIQRFSKAVSFSIFSTGINTAYGKNFSQEKFELKCVAEPQNETKQLKQCRVAYIKESKSEINAHQT